MTVGGNELWLTNSSIPAYQPGNTPPGYDPDRPRKLLMHKAEIKSLIGKSRQAGLTLIPLRVYSRKHQIKLELGLAKSKRAFDKRETIKKRDMERETRRFQS